MTEDSIAKLRDHLSTKIVASKYCSKMAVALNHFKIYSNRKLTNNPKLGEKNKSFMVKQSMILEKKTNTISFWFTKGWPPLKLTQVHNKGTIIDK